VRVAVVLVGEVFVGMGHRRVPVSVRMADGD
jgi:hypothetical protein